MKPADIAIMEKIQEHIEENLTKDIVVLDLCSQFKISRNKHQTLFKTHQGDTINEYIIKHSMYYVADNLINTNKTSTYSTSPTYKLPIIAALSSLMDTTSLLRYATVAVISATTSPAEDISSINYSQIFKSF